uniref:Uncharacterized protein n=1 Tax=Setaria italica TaxID=4555 RepID=K3Z261_SETIT
MLSASPVARAAPNRIDIRALSRGQPNKSVSAPACRPDTAAGGAPRGLAGRSHSQFATFAGARLRRPGLQVYSPRRIVHHQCCAAASGACGRKRQDPCSG